MIRTTGIINTPIGGMKDYNIYAVNRGSIQMVDPAVGQSTAYQKTLLSYDPMMPKIKKMVDRKINRQQVLSQKSKINSIKKLGIESKNPVQSINPTPTGMGPTPPAEDKGSVNYENLKREPPPKPEFKDEKFNFNYEQSLRSIFTDFQNQLRQDNERLVETVRNQAFSGSSEMQVDFENRGLLGTPFNVEYPRINTTSDVSMSPATTDESTSPIPTTSANAATSPIRIETLNSSTQTPRVSSPRVPPEVITRYVERIVYRNRAGPALLTALQNISDINARLVQRNTDLRRTLVTGSALLTSLQNITDLNGRIEESNRALNRELRHQLDTRRTLENYLGEFSRDLQVERARVRQLEEENGSLEWQLMNQQSTTNEQIATSSATIERLTSERNTLAGIVDQIFPVGYITRVYANDYIRILQDVRERGGDAVIIDAWGPIIEAAQRPSSVVVYNNNMAITSVQVNQQTNNQLYEDIDMFAGEIANGSGPPQIEAAPGLTFEDVTDDYRQVGPYIRPPARDESPPDPRGRSPRRRISTRPTGQTRYGRVTTAVNLRESPPSPETAARNDRRRARRGGR